MVEEWRDIKGYEGLYQVSSLGRVKSLNYNHTKKEKVLDFKPNKYGYKVTYLYNNNERKPYSVHRLVAEAFIPNPNNYKEVNHKDENKSNNCVDNLEWCTAKYNSNYGTRNKRISDTNKGINHPMYGKHHTDSSKDKISKTLREKGICKGKNNPKAHKVQCITTGKSFSCIKEASEYYHVNYLNIIRCCTEKRKSAGKHPVTGEKLVWKYLEEVE